MHDANGDPEDLARLSAYLDGELADPSDLERHVEACERCRAALAELRRLRGLVRGPELAPDPFFVVRFRARREALAEQALSAWRRIAVRLLLPAAAVAAALAMVTVRASDGDPDSFWDLERHALAAGSPRVRSAPESSELEPLLAAALGPREPERPRVTEAAER